MSKLLLLSVLFLGTSVRVYKLPTNYYYHSFIVMELLEEGETYQKIENNDFGPDDEPPVVMVVGSDLVVSMRTGMYIKRIPESGFTYMDIFGIANRLQISNTWLALELTHHEEYDGWNAGPYVADLAKLHNFNDNGETNPVVIAIMHRILNNINPNRTATDPTVITATQRITEFIRTHPAQHIPVLIACRYNPRHDEICPICMETSTETPHQTWAYAKGCQQHRFHWTCIRDWRGGTCPSCREPLLAWDGN